MSEASLDLLALFATKLFSIALAHAKHVVHTASSEESTLFLLSLASVFFDLATRRAASSITFEQLVEQHEEQGSDDHILEVVAS